MGLKNYLKITELTDQPNMSIFMNSHGAPLGRFGVRYIVKKRCFDAAKNCPGLQKKVIGPHTFRHTIAMHFLQAGIDLSIIKSWLGHVNLSTTHAYIEIDMEMKRKALEACSPANRSTSLKKLFDKNKDVLTWLDSLSKI